MQSEYPLFIALSDSLQAIYGYDANCFVLNITDRI